MLNYLIKRWFLISLAVLISSGLALGANLSVARVSVLTGAVNPRWITAIVLFLMSFSLDSRLLKAAFRFPLPVLWASVVNFGFIPLVAWPLMSLQLTKDFSIGLMVAATAPCTMAAASVWTRKAKGNDAVSLLVTVVTNGTCFLFTPLWLKVVSSQATGLDFWSMVERLVYAALIPMAVGQLLRIAPAFAGFATRHKTRFGVLAQALILTLVFSAACSAGTRLNGSAAVPSTLAVVVVWGSCIGLHLLAMFVGVTGARVAGFSRPDRTAITFACSQKTLPIGILVASTLAVTLGVPFAVFPILMFHASQLFIDTAIADRLARVAESERQPDDRAV